MLRTRWGAASFLALVVLASPAALAQAPPSLSASRAIEVARAAWDTSAWGPLPGADRGAGPSARLVSGANAAREARDHGWQLRRGSEPDVVAARRCWIVSFSGALSSSAAILVDRESARVLAIYLIPEG